MIEKNFHVIAFCGHSGSGKSTMQETIAEAYGLHCPRQITTRTKRNTDTNYSFITPDSFLKRVGVDIFEWDIVSNNLYGLSKDEFDMTDINLIVLTPSGMAQVKEYFGADNVTGIFVDAEEGKRRYRMMHRGDDEDKIEERIKTDDLRFKKAYHVCDYKLTSGTKKEDMIELINIFKEIETEKDIKIL